MNRLSKEAEDRLLAAVEQAAQLADGGEPPSSAVAKAAAAKGVPPGHASLLVHAYNTGRTTRQRQEGQDALEKAADFELASTEEVLELLYPSRPKTAAQLRQETAVSTQYALPPTGLLQRKAAREKAASPSIDWRSWSRADGTTVTAEAPPPLPSDPAAQLKKASAAVDRLRKSAEEARRQAAAAFDKLAGTFVALDLAMRRPDAPGVQTLREQAYLLHGAKAAQLVDELVKVSPGLAKLSRARPSPRGLVRAEGEAYALVSQFLDELDEHRRLKTAAEAAARDAQERSEALLAPFCDGPRSVLSEGPSWKAKQAAGLMPNPATVLGQIALAKQVFGGSAAKMQEPLSQGSVLRSYEDLTDPGHEQQLRGIRASAMLSDMLTNDPAIAAHDPNEALSAYNDIVEMAPRAADKHLLLQTLMRKRLEQGYLDPFEVDTVMGIENKQKQIEGGPDAQPPKKGGGYVSVLS